MTLNQEIWKFLADSYNSYHKGDQKWIEKLKELPVYIKFIDKTGILPKVTEEDRAYAKTMTTDLYMGEKAEIKNAVYFKKIAELQFEKMLRLEANDFENLISKFK